MDNYGCFINYIYIQIAINFILQNHMSQSERAEPLDQSEVSLKIRKYEDKVDL